jgi:hypothetical protein
LSVPCTAASWVVSGSREIKCPDRHGGARSCPSKEVRSIKGHPVSQAMRPKQGLPSSGRIRCPISWCQLGACGLPPNLRAN